MVHSTNLRVGLQFEGWVVAEIGILPKLVDWSLARCVMLQLMTVGAHLEDLSVVINTHKKGRGSVYVGFGRFVG